jgi:hypothetical protein
MFQKNPPLPDLFTHHFQILLEERQEKSLILS